MKFNNVLQIDDDFCMNKNSYFDVLVLVFPQSQKIVTRQFESGQIATVQRLQS